MKQALLLIASYVLGSVPFGLLIVKSWKGIDIRKFGSGNIGATNVLRTAGKGPAAVVFVADVLKGLIPVMVARRLFPDTPWMAVSAGLLAMIGHTLSIFLGFRGGKGVATGLGIFVGLEPRAAGIAFGIWLVVLGLTKYVSLASMIGAVSIPVLMFAFGMPAAYKAFGVFAAAFVLLKHRSNITRLLQGKESRIGEKVAVSEAEQC